MLTTPPARLLACALVVAALVAPVSALDRTWIGGNVDWVDGGAATNWNPNDEPDADDRALFNTANTVNLGSNNAVNGLDLSSGIDLNTNEFDLSVDGLVTVGGAGTNLFIGGAAGSVNADDVVINSGGVIELRGGSLTMDEEVGVTFLDINAGGTLQGNGVITIADQPGVTTSVLSNDGVITALSRGITIFSTPPVGELLIDTAVGTFLRVDMDGAAEAGVVNVNRNQTLDVNIAMTDAFNGSINLAHNSTFDFANTWTLGAGGSVVVNNGFVAGGLGFPDVPADTSFLKGGTINQTGGTISVADTDGTLQLDAPFTMTSGSFTNFGTVIFNGVTSITTAAGYDPSDVNSQTVVNANVTINDPAGNFNWDGNGAADTTVNNAALLSITANQIDTGDNVFGGTITLNNGGDLAVDVTGLSWTMAGALNKTGPSFSTVTGDTVTVTGALDVGGTGSLDMPQTTLASTANVSVSSLLILGGGSVLNGPATLTGTGELRMEGTSFVSLDTTVNVATFDWDGIGTGTTHTINPGRTLTINSATLDNDGDMDDPVTLEGSGSQLVVNSTNGLTQWTMNGVTTANSSGVGTATIGGTSRMIVANVINVDGNTNISAPVTFNGTALVADIDAAMTLDVTGASATYADGTIDGAGTFDPATTNTVTGDFAINADRFDFDGGSWIVEAGATLTTNSATDYEPDSVTNSFESTITLNNGGMFVNVADAAFVMNGTLNMNASGGFDAAEWQGDAIDIGNDAGVLDANLNVTGDGNPNSQGRFFSDVTFLSDADVSVPAGAALAFNRVVNFNTVNGVNNAEFTGAGAMIFGDDVNVNEAATINMVGGAVDLDGNDNAGDFVNIDAPLTINAASLANFGRVNGGGGVNTLDINNSVGTGVLTVNLDDAAAEWTLNGPGVMNLVNDNTDATLLAGSDVNINGTLNVTGDVRTTARLDIAGTVNVLTAGQPLRLAGGDSLNDPNTLAGGTITGAGALGADTGKELRGFGVINTGIDFDGSARFRADNGTLTINGSILDVGTIGTADADGVLHIPAAWNNNVTTGVQLNGGTLSGGTITNDATAGISGHGLVTSRVINNTQLFASLGPALVVQTAGNDNDWDGAAGVGELEATQADLEIRDVGAAFGFTGLVRAANGNRVFANGFALDFNPGSTLSLSSGTYESTSSTDIGGTVTVGVGFPSVIKVANNTFLTFETGSSVTLDSDLVLQNNNIIIQSGATFGGAAALIIDEPSHVVLQNGAAVNVVFSNEGTLRPGNSDGIATATLKDYVQTATGELFVELTGTLPNQYDRLLVSQTAQLDGFLSIDLDGGFDPALGTTFDILSSVFGVSGTFDTIDYASLPAGKTFAVSYLPNAVRLTTVVKPSFAADFDDDGDVDQTDYGIWKNAYALNQLGDANGDNVSDAADYTVWRDQLGSGPVAPAVAVPEPAAMAMLAAGLLVTIRTRRRSPRR